MSNYAEIHRHGEFSRLDGVGTAKQYAERAAELGYEFLGQTDHGTLSGALHHLTACRKNGIIPIVGVEAYYRPNRAWRKPIIKPHEAWHLILLAKNLRGWHNLLRLVSTSYMAQEDGGGFYQYPCIDDELLEKHHEGLICSTACFQSWLSRLILAGDYVAARDYIRNMKRLFRDDLYLEIMPHDFEDQRKINIEIVQIADEESLPLVATNDVHFVYPEWAETQRIAKMMSTNLSFSKVEAMKARGEDPPYMSELAPTLYLSTHDEMRSRFSKHHPELPVSACVDAIHGSIDLARTITPFLLDRSIKMPKVVNNEDEAEQILSAWIDEGMQQIYDEYPSSHWDTWDRQVYEKRIDFEWEILKSKGSIQYMVMIGDLCRWMREEGIRFGVRGSAAGCLISKLIGISVLDPIPWGLLFERFLNPGRKGLPDIDIDVQSGQRARVKQRVIDKYGDDHVADIITHERFQPKSVIQSLCRAFDVPYIEAHAVTDTIDIRQDDEETTLEELLPINEKLREFKGKYSNIWDHAIRLEGTVQNAGKHAAGVVITPRPIVEYMALERGKKGDLVTSWSDAADFMVITDNGFQKVDLLGLKSLERHEYACKLIKERHGIDVDLNRIGPERDPRAVDEKVMSIFRDGFTTGVFQFGSKGMTQLLKQIHPDNVLDLTAANALYRPGPMNSGVTWDYARIKRGDKEPEEWSTNPLVWPVLGETHGLIAYQEQVMEIAKRMGNFTPADADNLRKAMGKLYRIRGQAAREFMQGFHEIWVAGTEANGIPKKARKQVWDQILDKSGYSFNKSHSGYYSFQAYQDAWLKTNYPLEFYSAILTYPSGSSPQVKQDFINAMVREAKSREIKFLSPDVNSSGLGWVIDEDEDGNEGLRFNLIGIKDVGEVAAQKIIANRNGGFESIDDLRKRCGSKVNKKVIDALIESGALDCFGLRDTWSGQEIARCEKARLRMTIKGVSEADQHAELIRPNIFTQNEIASLPKGAHVIVGGEITKVEKKTTKTNKPFANITVEFEMEEWRCKFWQDALYTFEDLLVVGSTIMVSGKKDEWQGMVSVIAKDACDIESMIKDNERLDDDG